MIQHHLTEVTSCLQSTNIGIILVMYANTLLPIAAANARWRQNCGKTHLWAQTHPKIFVRRP